MTTKDDERAVPKEWESSQPYLVGSLFVVNKSFSAYPKVEIVEYYNEFDKGPRFQPGDVVAVIDRVGQKFRIMTHHHGEAWLSEFLLLETCSRLA